MRGISYRISEKIFGKSGASYSYNILYISVSIIAISVVIMVLSVYILNGFKNTIKDKIIGFTGDLQISELSLTPISEESHLALDSVTLEKIRQHPGVTKVSNMTYKSFVMKNDDMLNGTMFYGMDSTSNIDFFKHLTVEGHFPEYTTTVANDTIVVSKHIADKLLLHVDDKVYAYFLQDNSTRARRFVVGAIYNSEFIDYDKIYVLGDARQLSAINNWGKNEVNGYRIFLKSAAYTDEVVRYCNDLLDYDVEVKTFATINPIVFGWLDMQDTNVVILIVLMSVVCILAIISIMIIIVLEKTSTIGILKTLGMNNGGLFKIFLIRAIKITLYGIIIGNIVALTFSYAEEAFHILKLSPESYYMDYVPVDIDYFNLIKIDVLVLMMSVFAMILPSVFIAKTNPIKTISME